MRHLPKILIINKNLAISPSELRFRFARSGGPGGQNVNKLETRVELLFDVKHSPSLSEEHRERLLQNLKSRIDTQGILRIVSQGERSQWRNRESAIKRFVELIQATLKPKKKRTATRSTASSIEKRLKEKRRRSEIKKGRRIHSSHL